MTGIHDASVAAADLQRLEHDHVALLAALSSLRQASDRHFRRRYAGMVAGVERVFRSEQDLLEQAGPASFRLHLEEHGRTLGTLHRLAPRVTGGDVAAGRKAVALLLVWLPLHAAHTDKVLMNPVADSRVT